MCSVSASARLQARAASGAAMTMIRSPVSMTASPSGRIARSPRMMPTTLESSGTPASRSGLLTMWLVQSSGTSNSTICTSPSANTSVWRAAGMPMMLATALAVSTSGETMKSTSISRSRHASRYSAFDVRTTVRALDIRLASIVATRFTSSRDVEAMTRSDRSTPASASVRRLAPLPVTACTSKR